jgi:chromosome segregation ATPase
MARKKTFRKKRKYKHTNNNNNNNKRTSKKNYKKTYKKRRLMKGGNPFEELLGNKLYTATKDWVRDTTKTTINNTIAEKVPQELAELTQQRSEELGNKLYNTVNDPKFKKQVVNTGIKAIKLGYKTLMANLKLLDQEIDREKAILEAATRTDSIELEIINSNDKVIQELTQYIDETTRLNQEEDAERIAQTKELEESERTLRETRQRRADAKKRSEEAKTKKDDTLKKIMELQKQKREIQAEIQADAQAEPRDATQPSATSASRLDTDFPRVFSKKQLGTPTRGFEVL